MRKLSRRPLSAAARTALETLQSQVDDAPDPKARAKNLWNNKPRSPFDEVRTALEAMASGRDRCMYCEDNEGTDIEHFWPKSAYPELAFIWDNYLMACSACNSNHKRDRFPLDPDGRPLLLNPVDVDPRPHLRLVPTSGRFAGRTPQGTASIEIFDLNGDESGRTLPTGRRDTFVVLKELIVAYDRSVATGAATAADIERAILRFPFSSVLVYMVAIAEHPMGRRILGDDVVDVIERHRLSEWLDPSPPL